MILVVVGLPLVLSLLLVWLVLRGAVATVRLVFAVAFGLARLSRRPRVIVQTPRGWRGVS